LAGETEILGENLAQCHFVYRKSHMLCRDANPGRRGGKPVTNRLNYGAAKVILKYRPVKSPTLHSKCGINQGLIKNGKQNGSLKVAVLGPVFGPPLYIYTYIHKR
jgi:hypothetical protein